METAAGLLSAASIFILLQIYLYFNNNLHNWSMKPTALHLCFIGLLCKNQKYAGLRQ
jgi:hypothetical protein